MPLKPRFSIYIRATAFVMLFCMFHYLAGYRFMYSLGILFAKEEAKNIIGADNFSSGTNADIQKLTFSANDYNSLKWTKENKEFIINHQMFDAANIEKSGTTYVITVYCDG